MGVGTLIQVAIDIFLGVGLFLCAMRLARAPKDDPRLSRGLQLLQSKIAVLEDLSDKSETLVHQLTSLLDQKSRDVQARIEEAERHVHAVQTSIQRSLEVARIFEDKIPHQEIIERRTTTKYVQAARLAHQGLSPAEIAKRVDLSAGEIEFIAKVNKDRLMFSEDRLPAWADEQPHEQAEQQPAESTESEPSFLSSPTASSIPPRPMLEFVEPDGVPTLEDLGERFRQAASQGVEISMAPVAIYSRAPEPEPIPEPAPEQAPEPEPAIRKFEFPRIDATRPLARPTDNLA